MIQTDPTEKVAGATEFGQSKERRSVKRNGIGRASLCSYLQAPVGFPVPTQGGGEHTLGLLTS